MRIEGFSGGFLQLSGGTLTGPLVINSNAFPQITINAPDGASNQGLEFQAAAARRIRAYNTGGSQRLWLADNTGAPRFNFNVASAYIEQGRAWRDIQFATNAGAVTVLAATTEIAIISFAALFVGDLIYLYGVAEFVKGGTAGYNTLGFSKTAGAATYAALIPDSITYPTDSQLNGTTRSWERQSIFQVTGAGALTLHLIGQSNGSNSTVNIGAGGLVGVVMTGN